MRPELVLAHRELDEIDRANGVLPPLPPGCAEGAHPATVEVTTLGEAHRTHLCTTCGSTLLDDEA